MSIYSENEAQKSRKTQQSELRDKLAIAAMPHLNWLEGQIPAAAKYCYEIADAMLQARGQDTQDAAPCRDLGPWYPDDSGEWVEVPDEQMWMPNNLPEGRETPMLAMSKRERQRRNFIPFDILARQLAWEKPNGAESRIVAYRVVK